MEKQIAAKKARLQELGSQAADMVDAGHFDPKAVEGTKVLLEEK
jgi:hypothetical protein